MLVARDARARASPPPSLENKQTPYYFSEGTTIDCGERERERERERATAALGPATPPRLASVRARVSVVVLIADRA